MNLPFERIMRAAEGRYLTDAEEESIYGYAEGIERRLDVLSAIERAEDAILDDVTNEVMRRYGDPPQRHGSETDKRVRRDQMMVLRYAALAMLQRDPDYLHSKLSVWLRTILKALCDLEVVLFGYEQLKLAVERHLTRADADALLPFLDVHIEEFKSVRRGAA